jgi:hypothetical protein
VVRGELREEYGGGGGTGEEMLAVNGGNDAHV